ncbi:MAG: class I SAM-dependent methyltransferase [Caldilinea sp.]|nr:class I SAM-dependent methyltransferase [Caldilinea sp.]MCB0067366.1 class I SAM-dependent methyltransferase [Caldilineaceae bacterium]MCB0038236.1 class I SAM-dependent methyltransferase [Caldilinea sp.]MCB0050008.1 class I SAM-dependent methyltransferase [Caldilinea sp.]MCB0148018.1 class I SAM-dependent methyltransferase [Caldilineaceae bacterium]
MIDETCAVPRRHDNLLAQAYAWACEQIYHDLAWAYDAISWGVSGGAWGDWRTLALEAATGRILELGFGTGELIAAALEQCRPIVGLERSPQMQAIALAKLRRARLPVPLAQGSALALPFAAGSFDTVIATFPAGYIVEPATLAECARVLVVGGRLIIAGVWIVPVLGRHAINLPLLYRAPEASEAAGFIARIEAAGFVAGIHWRQSRWADVAVIRAERRPGPVDHEHCA